MRTTVKIAAGICVIFALVILETSLAAQKQDFARQKDLIILDEDNWSDMLENEWMVEFFAPWCPACKGMEDTWRSFASWGTAKGIKVAQVDVTLSPGLSGRFMVTALPTIYHVINGEFRQYKGSRDRDSFVQFVAEKKWQQVEPVPYWKSPNSPQMSIVSSFFKLSQYLRHVHTKLMDEYGLPQWGSYLIFAVATILLGAILGLGLVCIIDVIFPPKKPKIFEHYVSAAAAAAAAASAKGKIEKKPKASDEDDELGDDEIKDDLLDDAADDDDDEIVAEKDTAAANNGLNNSPQIKKRKARRID